MQQFLLFSVSLEIVHLYEYHDEPPHCILQFLPFKVLTYILGHTASITETVPFHEVILIFVKSRKVT